MILALDPGLRHCGCAVFDRAGLIGAALVKNTEKKARGPGAALSMAAEVGRWARMKGFSPGGVLVLEYPRVYPGMRDNDPNDLIELACVDGALAAWFSTETVHYFPSEWKGQVPANPTARQILKRLRPDEMGRVEKVYDFAEALARAEARQKDVAHSTHNTLDAVGIGLKYLGRF